MLLQRVAHFPFQESMTALIIYNRTCHVCEQARFAKGILASSTYRMGIETLSICHSKGSLPVQGHAL